MVALKNLKPAVSCRHRLCSSYPLDITLLIKYRRQNPNRTIKGETNRVYGRFAPILVKMAAEQNGGLTHYFLGNHFLVMLGYTVKDRER